MRAVDATEEMDPVAYARAIHALRKAAAVVAGPLLENGADLATVTTMARDLAQVGVQDAWREVHASPEPTYRVPFPVTEDDPYVDTDKEEPGPQAGKSP